MSTNQSPTAPTLGLTLLPTACQKALPCRSILCLLIHSDGRPSSVERPTYTDRPRCRPPRKRGHCLNCHEDTHSLKQCRHPFINTSGRLNPDLGQFGDDGDAYPRLQARVNRYRRGDKRSLSNNQKKQKNNHRHRGHSRGQH